MTNIFKVKYVFHYWNVWLLYISTIRSLHMITLTLLQILGISLFGASVWILFDTSNVITVVRNGKLFLFFILLNRVTRKLEVAGNSFV